jgi:hypothetical protein
MPGRIPIALAFAVASFRSPGKCRVSWRVAEFCDLPADPLRSLLKPSPPQTLDPRAEGRAGASYPFVRANSFMNPASASAHASGTAL